MKSVCFLTATFNHIVQKKGGKKNPKSPPPSSHLGPATGKQQFNLHNIQNSKFRYELKFGASNATRLRISVCGFKNTSYIYTYKIMIKTKRFVVEIYLVINKAYKKNYYKKFKNSVMLTS